MCVTVHFFGDWLCISCIIMRWRLTIVISWLEMRLAMSCLSTNRPDTASVSLILFLIKAFIRSAILLFLLLSSWLCCSCFHLLLRPSHGRIRRSPISYLKTWFYPLPNAHRKQQTSAAHLFYHDKKGLRSLWKRFVLVRKKASARERTLRRWCEGAARWRFWP
mgnify:FL=1